ncbi:hypothetical protein JKP88DRAFT_347071 [Tribonema minus]|uniref:Uncharacterized protein n=1 Tax=Tribonema minus TaxID=303371 RepID=A0A836C950_9STRA|nr:hypothetical protein JKP88DRAFT_347071 [Tribonema minus]
MPARISEKANHESPLVDVAVSKKTKHESAMVDVAVVRHILAFLPPSIMVRSTCRIFRSAIKERTTEGRRCTVAADAVANVSLFRWAMQNGLKASLAQNSCTCRGDVSGLRLLRDHFHMQLYINHTSRAAAKGQLLLLQWLRQEGCPCDPSLCNTALQAGHFEAAAAGHLEVLQWARANGCPWDSETCRMAARGGHQEVLHWACDNGCPWAAPLGVVPNHFDI